MEWGGGIPGGARLEDLAHRASAGCLLEGAYCIAHGDDGDVRLATKKEKERASGEGQDGGEKARKGVERYLYCEGTGRRQVHAVPAHVADQVHLGES